MKNYHLLIIGALLLAACSPPKYAYYFDHYDYNSGRKKIETQNIDIAYQTLSAPEMSPLHLNQEAVTASARSRIEKTENVDVMARNKALFEKKYSAMTKAEKKDFRKELKSEVRKMIKAKKSGESISAIAANKVMDHDLKMALIFTVIAIVLSAFGGANSVFWILGVISIVVAIVFFIQWLARQ